MKQYVYKMQWLFPINGNALQTKSQGRKNINSFIDIVNAKSFTVVYFRDCDLKIVDSYTNMVMYNTEKEANKKLKDLVKSIYQELRTCRSNLSCLIDKAWELGGYCAGEKGFEQLNDVKDAREQSIVAMK